MQTLMNFDAIVVYVVNISKNAFRMQWNKFGISVFFRQLVNEMIKKI